MNYIMFSIFCFILLVSPFAISNRCYDLANLPQSLFIQSSIDVLFAIYLIYKSYKNDWNIKLGGNLGVIFVIYIAVTFISWQFAVNTGLASRQWHHLFACYCAFLFSVNICDNFKKVTYIALCVLIAGVGVALVGMAQYFFNWRGIIQTTEIGSTFANKNMAAQVVVFSIPLGIFCWSKAKNKFAEYASVIAISINSAFLVYTATRAAWLSVLIQLSILTVIACFKYKQSVFIFRHRYQSAFFGIFLFVILVHLNAHGFYNPWKRLEGRFQSIAQTGEVKVATLNDGTQIKKIEGAGNQSISNRLSRWANALEMAKDYKYFGIGLSNFRVFYPKYHLKLFRDPEIQILLDSWDAHNDYVQTIAELGLLGLVLLLAFLFYFLKMALRSIQFGLLPICVSLACGGALINAFFSFPLERAIPPFYGASLVGACIGLIGSGGYSPKFSLNTKELKIIGLYTSSVLMAIYSFFILHNNIGRYKADQAFKLTGYADQQKRWDDVHYFAKRVVKNDSSRYRVNFFIARAFLEQKKYNLSIEYSKKTLKYFPYDFTAYWNLAQAYEGLKSYDLALDNYKKAQSIKPYYPFLYNNIGTIFVRQHKLKKALQQFINGKKMAPDNALFYRNLASVYVQLGDLHKAKDNYIKAVELAPNREQYYLMAGNFLYKTKDYQTAYKIYQEGVNRFSQNAKLNKNLGVVLYVNLGKKKLGVTYLKRALELDSSIDGAQNMKKIINIYKGKRRK